MRVAHLAVAATSLLAACSDAKNPSAVQPAGPGPIVLEAVEHDFGIIPHGEAREHEFVFDLDQLGQPYVPLRVQLDCSCGRADMHMRGGDGSERTVDGSPSPDNLPRAGERLVVRVVIDTLTKEPVDLPKTVSRGHLLLQSSTDQDGTQRVRWPILLRFGIDAPVAVHPFAELDFGRVPISQTGEIVTTLQGDEHHPNVTFGPVATTSKDLEATLEPIDNQGMQHVLLRTRCRPRELGSFRGIVGVATDLASGYRVNIGAVWKVVPDLEASPGNKLSFRADLSRAQRPDEIAGQFVIVSDHDTRRSPEFAVHAIVGDDDRDAASSFAVTLVPIPGQPRQHRMFVRYLGGRPQGFRGRVELSKGGAEGPFLTIELVAFPTNKT